MKRGNFGLVFMLLMISLVTMGTGLEVGYNWLALIGLAGVVLCFTVIKLSFNR